MPALTRPSARIKLPQGWEGYWWSVDGKDRYSIDHPSEDGECLTADPAFPDVPCKFIGYGEDAWQECVDAAIEAGLPIEIIEPKPYVPLADPHGLDWDH